MWIMVSLNISLDTVVSVLGIVIPFIASIIWLARKLDRIEDNTQPIKTINETIPHRILQKYKAAKVLLKPAPKGTGLKAGGPVRMVLELTGIKNIVSKMLGSKNKINNVKATFEALKKLKAPKVYPVKKEVKKEEIKK